MLQRLKQVARRLGIWRAPVSLRPDPNYPGLAQIEKAEARLLQLPQVDVPIRHLFAPGVYFREVTMPAGVVIIGHEHTTEHFNVVLTGRATVVIEGDRQELVAPCVFVSQVGVRKILYIHEEMRWATIHATPETDVSKLEALLVTRSDSWVAHQKQIQQKEIKCLS